MSSTRGPAGRRRLTLALVGCIALAMASTALAASVSTGSYSGTNSEHQTVTFKIVSGGAALTNFKSGLGYNGKCGQGGGPDFNVKVSRIAIGAGGKFAKKTTLKLFSTHAPGEVSGTAHGSRVTGKIVEFLNGKANKCYTETFSASLG
jgi:hypothetical protein